MADKSSPPLQTEDDDGFGDSENNQQQFKPIKMKINKDVDYDSQKMSGDFGAVSQSKK